MYETSLNPDAYETLFQMDFKVLDVLHQFGIEIWENNALELEGLTENEVSSAFVRLMLDQVSVLNGHSFS
jgi:hypothetical protein